MWRRFESKIKEQIKGIYFWLDAKTNIAILNGINPTCYTTPTWLAFAAKATLKQGKVPLEKFVKYWSRYLNLDVALSKLVQNKQGKALKEF